MKIKLTEGQLRRLHNITEGADNRYNSLVKLDFTVLGGRDVTGLDINDIPSLEVRVSYDIDIEARSWGIKGISLFGISGPDTVDLEVEVFTNEDGDYETKTFPLKLDWETLRVETETGRGVVTIDDVIEVSLVFDQERGFLVKEMVANVFSL